MHASLDALAPEALELMLQAFCGCNVEGHCYEANSRMRMVVRKGLYKR